MAKGTLSAMVQRSDVFTEDLPCKLSGEELAEEAQKLTDLLVEIESLEGKKKAVASDFKGKIDALKARVKELTGVVTHGEVREVECQWDYDWENATKALIRLDTEEEVRVVPVTEEDRQMVM